MPAHVLSYWPFDLVFTGKTRTFKYTDKTGVVAPFSSVFSYDAAQKQLVCADYDAAGAWQDSWRMVYDPRRGVCECSDWYPQSNPELAAVFGPVQKENLAVPIIWGGVVEIGRIISNSPTYDAITSTPPFCVNGSGFQAVEFEEILPTFGTANGVIYQNVLVFSYAQTWNGKTKGARYWMAPGVGPVAISWIGYDASGKIAVVEPRCDASVANT